MPVPTILQYYTELLESGIFIRDFGMHIEEINLANTGTLRIKLSLVFYV